MRRSDLIVVVTSVGSEEQALDIAHALIRNRQVEGGIPIAVDLPLEGPRLR